MKTHEYLTQAAAILQSLMDNEGALTDEEEAELETWAEGTGDKLEAWRAVYRRAESEAALWKAEKARIVKVQKRAESLMVRAKLAGVEILSARSSGWSYLPLINPSSRGRNVEGATTMLGTSYSSTSGRPIAVRVGPRFQS